MKKKINIDDLDDFQLFWLGVYSVVRPEPHGRSKANGVSKNKGLP